MCMRFSCLLAVAFSTHHTRIPIILRRMASNGNVGSDIPNPNSKSQGVSQTLAHIEYDSFRFSAKKAAKLAEKQAKQAVKVVKEVSLNEKKEKVKTVKEPKEEEMPFVNTTPKGHKKGAYDASNTFPRPYRYLN